MNKPLNWLPAVLAVALAQVSSSGAGLEGGRGCAAGYYRFPALAKDTLVFVAEGDLWQVDARGGAAHRLTTHPGQESNPVISPDGTLVAFSAEYEGPLEVYTMPLAGGAPTRRTFDGEGALAVGWTPDGQVLYATRHYSTLPDYQLARINLESGAVTLLPLSQASDGAFDPESKVFFFTRQGFQGSSTKRYQGGTAQNLWKYPPGCTEATPLTADYSGTSKAPMWWQGRVYFMTDRDGTMNLWSMNPDGADLRQHTRHKGWDVKGASLSAGRIAYQVGADLRLLDLAAKTDVVIPICLVSDFDQEREKWVKQPLDYLTSAHLSPDGDRLALTARGQVFVAPVKQGRFVEVTRDPSVRYREGRFLPDGRSVVALSDQSGELEFARLPANGVGQPEPLSSDGKVFRFGEIPSPDGQWLAYQDKNQELWLLELGSRQSRKLATNAIGAFSGLAWAPDSRWLAYAAPAENHFERIVLYHVPDGQTTFLTSDRVNSYSPAWTPDGKWIYFLSERQLQSAVRSPWGLRAPEPFFYEPVGIYLVALQKDGRSPFEPNDELHPGKGKKKPENHDADKAKEPAVESAAPAKEPETKPGPTNPPPELAVDLEGIAARAQPVPVPAGNYSQLSVNSNRLFWVAHTIGAGAKTNLMMLELTNDDPKPKALIEETGHYELSLDGKKILVRKGDEFYVVDAGKEAPVKLEKGVELKGWTFSLNPRQERRQMFVEAWRLMRDYFYDPNMHGVDWPAVREKYLPLVDRVRDRAELSDLLSDMVGELSALHIFVRGGDFREGPDQVQPASLGAVLAWDEAQAGYRVERIYRADPDYPEAASPLARPGVNVAEGDVLLALNGVPLRGTHPAALLRNQAGRQTLLSVRPRGSDAAREVIVRPITQAQEAELRYNDWEYARRRLVEELGRGEIGYVHLRAMGTKDIAAWARDFYPVFNRQGLIVDVRHNRGGNIDSWVLEKLLRKAWFYWQPRVGAPVWNMQYAFRGHTVVLCNEKTASDGEAFTEGIRRLGIGKSIGTRTWGGEIWLSFDNVLVDKGIASAAETGVYGPEGKWLIEGHGVDPDLVVDNLPCATFNGDDAQLKAAIRELQEQIRLRPVAVPPPPPHPDKAFK